MPRMQDSTSSRHRSTCYRYEDIPGGQDEGLQVVKDRFMAVDHEYIRVDLLEHCVQRDGVRSILDFAPNASPSVVEAFVSGVLECAI